MPGVWPLDTAARAWGAFGSRRNALGFQALRNVCSMNIGLRIRLHQLSPALQADLSRLGALWAQGVECARRALAGRRSFRRVDAFFAPVATRVQSYGLPLPQPAAQYVQRLLDFTPVSEWVSAGIAEPWRDAGHEGRCAGTR